MLERSHIKPSCSLPRRIFSFQVLTALFLHVLARLCALGCVDVSVCCSRPILGSSRSCFTELWALSRVEPGTQGGTHYILSLIFRNCFLCDGWKLPGIMRIHQDSIKIYFSVCLDLHFRLEPNLMTSFRKEDMHL